MNEPFSALDPMTRRTLQQEVRALQQKLNKTFVFVTHDMAEALDLADVIIFMDHGRIVQMPPPGGDARPPRKRTDPGLFRQVH